jgi:hypothetical protein
MNISPANHPADHPAGHPANPPAATGVRAPDLAEIQALDHQALLARTRYGVEHFDPRVFELTDEQLDTAWMPDAAVGRWPIRVLLGHLADAEIVNAHRIRRAFGEDRPTLAVWDEDAFIDSGLYGCTDATAFRPPIGGDIAAIHTTRSWMVAMLFQFEDQHWTRQAMHPELGPISIRHIADYNCWHLENHAAYLNAKVAKFLGPAPLAEDCSAAGCDRPGCACVQDGTASETQHG